MEGQQGLPNLPDDKRIMVEETFLARCIQDRVKFDTPTFYTKQAEFFTGAMAMIQDEYILSPKWSMCIMSRRPIIEPYKL